MIRSFKDRRERERRREHIFTSYFCRCCQLDFPFIVKDLFLRVKNIKRCHAEVKQYCSMYLSDTK